VASVNATGSIVSLVVNAFIGISVRTRIVLARSIGKRDEEQIRKVTDTSLIFALVMGVLVTAVGLLLAPWFLDLTRCPEECYDGALLYIRIYVCSAPIILLYNFGSAVLTADGDTQRPLYYIMIGGATNVVLNIVLCLILPQKVAAVAIATVASQVVGGALVLKRLFTMDGYCKISIRKMKFDTISIGKVLATGLPTALVNAIFPLSNLQIQSAINSFGVSAMAGSGASATIEAMAYAGGQFGVTSAVFIGQNIGAGKPDRVRKSFRLCALLSVAVGIVLGFALYLSGRFWLGLIVGSDQQAIEYGIVKMACICLPVFINSLTNVYESSLQARGYAFLASVNAIVFVLVFRIVWMQFVFAQYPTWLCLMLCFTVSWTFRLLFDVVIHPIIRRRSDRKLFK
jgi:Na+-driven multidrug efflux pump